MLHVSCCTFVVLLVSVYQRIGGLFELGPGDFGIQNLAVLVHRGIGLFELGPGDFGIQNLAVSVGFF